MSRHSHHVHAGHLNKELRPLAQMAYDQGWKIKRLGNGHLRWMPPNKGPFVHSSGNLNTPAVLQIVTRDLLRAGLKIDGLKSQNTRNTPAMQTNAHATTSLGDALKEAESKKVVDPPPPPPPPPKNKGERKAFNARTKVEEFLQKEHAHVWTTQELVKALAIPRINVDSALKALLDKGKIKRYGRAQYRWETHIPTTFPLPTAPASVVHSTTSAPRTGEPVAVPPIVAGARTGDSSVDKDLQELDEALAALARIESVVRKHRTVIIQLAQLKKVLSGITIGE